MKKITLWLLTLFACSQMNAQLWNIVSCGTSGTLTYGPMYTTTTANANNRTAVIYPASQLTTLVGQNLNAMYFNRTTTTGSMAGTPNFKIYIKEVTATDWGTTALDWATGISGATLVYDSNPATIVGSTAGWKMFPLSTNFLYSGQNLAVFYEYKNTTASTSISWNYEFTSPCVNTSNSYTTKYSNNTTGILSASLGSSDYRRPMIGFDFVVSCNRPNTLVSSNLGTTSVDVSWTENAIQPQNGYEYYYSTSSTAPLPTTTPSGSTTTGVSTATLTMLTPATKYYVWVRGNCGASDKSVWTEALTFTTNCVDVTSFVETFDTTATGAGNLPTCWSMAGTGSIYNTTGSIAPMSPSNKLYMYISTTTSAYAVMPSVSNLQANTHRLRFRAYATSAAKNISVGYFATPGNEATYVEISSLLLPSTTVALSEVLTVIPTGIPAGVKQLVFKLATASTSAYIDDVKWEVNSSCVEPSSLAATLITNTGATLGWTNGGTETAWEIQYGLNGFTLGSGTMVTPVAANPYLLNGLAASTTYQYYVRAVCAGSINSSWAGPFAFKTLCNDVTTFSENFDSYLTGSTNPMPDCWNRLLVGAGSSYVTSGATAPYMSPANRLYIYAAASATSPTEAYAIMPNVSNLQAGTHRLKFNAYASTADRYIQVGYMTDITNASTYVNLTDILLPGTAIASTIQSIFTPAAGTIPAGVKSLVFRNIGYAATNTGYTVYIDDVIWEAVPACAEPTALTVASITNGGATLGWTNGGTETAWQIQYGLNGFAIGTGTTINASSNPYPLSGLAGNTTYQYYVRAACSGSNSPWTGPLAFKTLCGDVTTFSENFDTSLTGSTNPMPDCWNRLLVGAGSSYVTTGSVAPMSPANKLYLYASATTPTEAFAIMPAVSNLQANTHRLKFKGYTTTAGRTVQVGYMTDITNASTFVQLQEVTLPSTAVANTEEFTILPGALPAGVKYLAFHNVGYPGSTATIYIDDVKWEVIPTCPEPTALTVTSITNGSATLAWTNGGTETAWEIQYGLNGFTLGSGTMVTPVAANPYLLNGLTGNTTYQYYVRAVCGGSSGPWSNPFTFKTLCDDVTTYFENFDSYTSGTTSMPDCWSKLGTGTTYITSGSVAPMSSANKLYMYASATTPTVAYAVLKNVSNLQANTHRLKFKAYATTASKMLIVGYLTNPLDFNTFVQLQELAMPSTAVANTQEFAISPGALPAGVKCLAFKNDGTGASTAIYIDDVSWELIPSIAPTCATNIVATPNATCGNFATAITWNATPVADGYYLSIGTSAGSTDVMNNTNIGNVTSYSFVGNFNTTYYYTLKPYNAVGTATGCVEQSFATFATGCYCTPIYTTGPTSGDLISNVVISGTTLSNNSGTTASTSYTYFSGQPNYTASMQVGSTYDMTVTVGTFGSQYFAVWIDFNNNLTFEDSEKVGFVTTAIAAGSSATVQLVLACNAPVGQHRMRVRDVYLTAGNLIDPCASYTYGETEDYTITISAVPTPTGSATQSIPVANASDATIEDLVTTPSTVNWYPTMADAIANTNQLAVGTQLVDNTTYYAVNVQNSCLSTPFAVTATVVLGVNGFDNASFMSYPNPVNSILNLSYSSEISSVKVINLLGQELLSKKVLNNTAQIDMSNLSVGTYIVNVTIGDVVKTIKVLKQ